MVRTASHCEVEVWDDLVLSNPDGGNVFQGKIWGECQRRRRWTPRRLICDLDDCSVAIQMLEIEYPRLGKLWYCPGGPGVITNAALLKTISSLRALNPVVSLIQIEPQFCREEADLQQLQDAGLQPTPAVNRRDATIKVDLIQSEEELLKTFKHTTVQHIDRGLKRGVVIREATPSSDDVLQMYALMAATSQRNRFQLRPYDYFNYWREQSISDQGRLFFAEHEGQILCGAFVQYFGRRAWYKDGGSFAVKRELNAPTVLQWHIMRWLKAKGVESYDLFGVPDPAMVTPTHPRFGLYRFKTNFSRNIFKQVGLCDIPIDLNVYASWRRLSRVGGGSLLTA